MKRILYLLLAVCWTALAVNCGGSDGGEDDPQPQPGADTLVLKISKDTVVNNGFDGVTFTVWLGNKDVTAGSTIAEQKSHKQVEGAMFTPEMGASVGKYIFTAQYKKLSSSPVTLEVIDAEWFVRHALVQQKTSTFCVYCEALIMILEQDLIFLSPGRIDLMAFHGDMTAGQDPFTVSYTLPLFNKFGLSGFPQALINHNINWSTSVFSNDVVQAELDQPGIVGIALEPTVSGRQLTVNVGVKSQVNFEKPCRVAVAVLENGLSAPQMGKVITHNWVVRSYLSELFGDAEESGQGKIAREEEWTKQYTYTIPDEYVVENMDVIVYVLDASGKALNSRKVKIGEKGDYELNE